MCYYQNFLLSSSSAIGCNNNLTFKANYVNVNVEGFLVTLVFVLYELEGTEACNYYPYNFNLQQLLIQNDINQSKELSNTKCWSWPPTQNDSAWKSRPMCTAGQGHADKSLCVTVVNCGLCGSRSQNTKSYPKESHLQLNKSEMERKVKF